MKKFKFKFTAVEKVRKSHEDEALRVLAVAQQAFNAAKEHRNSLEKEMVTSLIRREGLGKESVGIVVFQLENDFIKGTKVRILQAENAIKKASRGVEKALRGYLHARRQMKMIEVLREKALADFKREAAKKEQKDLDDLYVMRAHLSHSEYSESDLETLEIGESA